MKHTIRLTIGLALLTSALPADAHFLWLLTDSKTQPPKLHVYFSESAEPDDPDHLDMVLKAEAWTVGNREEPKALTLTKGTDSLVVDLNGDADKSTIILRHNYGVTSRNGEAFLLKYYAKTYPFALPGTWKAVKDSDRLPLEIVPSLKESRVVFQVLWNGKPLPAATVTIVGPGIKNKVEGPTDESGNFLCDLPQTGVYSIRARHSESISGTFEDKEYKSVRNYSTLTLHYQPAQLTPSTHNFPELPKGMTSFGGAIAGDTLYIFGGNYGGSHEFTSEDQSGDLWKLNLANPDKWQLVSSGPHRQGLAMVPYKGSLYRVGGFITTNKSGEKQNLISQNDFSRLRDDGQWESLPSLPEPRSSHDAALIGDTLYVVGGWNMQGGGSTTKWHDTALAMKLSADKLEWKEIAAPGFHRRALAVAAWNGKLVCIGGMTESNGPTTKTAIYDPATDRWSDGPALQGTGLDGFGSSAFAVGPTLYATTISGSIQALDRTGSQWQFMGQLAHPRFFHRVLPWQESKLVIVGGASMETGKTRALDLLDVDSSRTAAQ